MKKIYLLCLLLSACVLLTSCTGGIPIASNTSGIALPDGNFSGTAPVGDAGLASTQKTLLYFPSYDDISLSTTEENVAFFPTHSRAESIVRAMIAFEGTGVCSSLGGSVALSLYGSHPVECSRNTVIINLGPSALRLNRGRLYMVGQAFANTLCQLDGISYVSLLVAGKAVGMDVGNTLAMGSFENTREKDINALYKQKSDRKSASSYKQYFIANATLYFPLAGMDALVCNTQSISFSTQNTADIVQAILSKLALGLGKSGSTAPQLPLLNDFLTYKPVLIESKEAGGTILQLNFAQNLEDMLDAYHVSKEASMASLCKTFCGFIPNILGIRVSIDGSPVDSNILYENSDKEESGQLYLYADVNVPVYDYAQLYFCNEAGELIPSMRFMDCGDCMSPRRLLLELAKGPMEGDSVSGLQAIMPANAITDSCIIGLSMEDSTLYVNFSPTFYTVCEDMEAEQESRFVYSIVNTLCADPAVKALAFFMGGEQFDGFDHGIYWRGLFYPQYGIKKKSS